MRITITLLVTCINAVNGLSVLSQEDMDVHHAF